MSNRIERYLDALCAPVQVTEEGLTQLLRERGVDTAEGAQLDAVGAKVGQARGGMADEEFRIFIRARISANKSNGSINDILRVIGLVLNDDDAALRLEPQPPAAFTLHVEETVVDDDVADVAAVFLRQTASAAVRALLHTFPVAETGSFAFDDSPDGLGFDDEGSPGAGGAFSTIQE